MPARTRSRSDSHNRAMIATPLWDATTALHSSGRSLMERVLPDDGSAPEQWQHYPTEDAVTEPLGARWFYHCHDSELRPPDEHGHFHLFVARRAMPRRIQPLIVPPDRRRPRPSTVHIAALVFDHNGLPARWVATNRWVTDEWLYPAEAITQLIPHIGFSGPEGDLLVGSWLTAMLHASLPTLAEMLGERDRQLMLLAAHKAATKS